MSEPFQDFFFFYSSGTLAMFPLSKPFFFFFYKTYKYFQNVGTLGVFPLLESFLETLVLHKRFQEPWEFL